MQRCDLVLDPPSSTVPRHGPRCSRPIEWLDAARRRLSAQRRSQRRMRIWPGQPAPLGASYDGTGTHFALFSEVAERVELCLFAEDGTETHLDMPERTGQIWHGYVPDVVAGQQYGYR